MVKKSRQIFLITAIFLSILMINYIGISNVSGFTKEVEKIVQSDADAYINEGTSENFGSSSSMIAGLGNSFQRKCYIHYSYNILPETIVSAIIKFKTEYVSYSAVPFNLTFCIVESSWDEMTITGQNNPAPADFITNVTFPLGSANFEIDITNFIGTKNNISICIYGIDNPYVRFYTKESAYWNPKLYLTYSEEASLNFITPTDDTEIDSSKMEIQWESTENIEEVNLYLYTNSETSTIIKENLENSGSYTWDIPESMDNECRLKIVDAENSSIYAYSDYFNISYSSVSGYEFPLIIIFSLFTIIGISYRIGKKKRVFKDFNLE